MHFGHLHLIVVIFFYPFFYRQPVLMSVSLHLWTAVGFVIIINSIVATLHDVTMLAEQVAMYRLLTHSGRISIVRYVEPRLLWQSPMEPHTFLASYLSHGGDGFLDALLEATGTQSVFVRLSRHK